MSGASDREDSAARAQLGRQVPQRQRERQNHCGLAEVAAESGPWAASVRSVPVRSTRISPVLVMEMEYSTATASPDPLSRNRCGLIAWSCSRFPCGTIRAARRCANLQREVRHQRGGANAKGQVPWIGVTRLDGQKVNVPCLRSLQFNHNPTRACRRTTSGRRRLIPRAGATSPSPRRPPRPKHVPPRRCRITLQGRTSSADPAVTENYSPSSTVRSIPGCDVLGLLDHSYFSFLHSCQRHR